MVLAWKVSSIHVGGHLKSLAHCIPGPLGWGHSQPTKLPLL